ncbi:MAG: 4-hydroxy-tetrahydrodipicolinate reductase [Firmicutes bacterium]|nr:4-hydroxy-tetrahydrodipicolinate reductase [Bacillota bacterium]
MRIYVSGDDGRMGTILTGIIKERQDLHLVSREESPDVVIDFSHPSVIKELTDYCRDNKIPLVIATTGYSKEEEAIIESAGREIPIFKSANMSVGVALVSYLAKEIAAKFKESDVEIIETHHNRKLDAPSGTALMLADAVSEARPESVIKTGRSGHAPREKNEIGIQSVRVGNVVGTHEIIFGTDSQSIKLIHEAHDRALFAEGALEAARFVIGKAPGMYDMKDLIQA